MNFSEQHSLRKPLSLILAAALTATLFTGCMKKDPATPEDRAFGNHFRDHRSGSCRQ